MGSLLSYLLPVIFMQVPYPLLHLRTPFVKIKASSFYLRGVVKTVFLKSLDSSVGEGGHLKQNEVFSLNLVFPKNRIARHLIQSTAWLDLAQWGDPMHVPCRPWHSYGATPADRETAPLLLHLLFFPGWTQIVKYRSGGGGSSSSKQRQLVGIKRVHILY